MVAVGGSDGGLIEAMFTRVFKEPIGEHHFG